MSFYKKNKIDSLTDKEAAIIYDAESINIVYETKPEIIERLLPPPLEPFEQPLVRVYIANFPRTNFGIVYKEAAMFLICQYKGDVGVYTLSMPVDNDMAMVLGREFLGYPKKIGNIHFEKNKNDIKGWVERNGVRFVEIEAKIGIKIPEKQAIKHGLGANKSESFGYNFKQFIHPNSKEFDYKPRLVKEPLGFDRKELRNAKATIKFQSSKDDPWAEVEVVKIIGAFYQIGTTSMFPGEFVAEVEHKDFFPYAFLKWDENNI